MNKQEKKKRENMKHKMTKQDKYWVKVLGISQSDYDMLADVFDEIAKKGVK